MLRAELTVPEIFRCVTRSLVDVVPRALSWVWPGWIPRGSLSLVVGAPGVGKSLYALQLAAMVTRGWTRLPTSPGREDLGLDAAAQDSASEADRFQSQSGQASVTETVGTPGTVVLFEPGDGASILRARLDAAGADVEKIVLVERNWRGDSSEEVEEFLETEPRQPARRLSRLDKDRELRRDLESLEQHVVQLRQAGHEVSLVIIDPIESLLRDAVDKHRLARLLSELAEELNVAIVAVGTTSSTPRGYPGLRIDSKGVDAFFKLSKTVVTVVRDLEDERQRTVLPTIVKLSAAPRGLTFTFADDGSLAWQELEAPLTEQIDPTESSELGKSAGEGAPRQDGVGKELNRAKQWLRARLTEGGVPVQTLFSEARTHQISQATLRRAYNQLDCVSKKSSGSSSGQWVWHLTGSTDDEASAVVLHEEGQTTERAAAWDLADRVHEVASESTR